MPTFRIEQYELHSQRYTVEAESEAEAICKLFDGEASPVADRQEYIQIADSYGLPVAEHQPLADELCKLGYEFSRTIESIRSIEVE